MLTAVLALLLLTSPLSAADVTVAWDDSGEPWATYLYASTTPDAYTINAPVARAEVGVTQATVDGLVPGTTYYFVATHYDDASGMESDWSTEINYTPDIVPNDKVITPVSEAVIMEPLNVTVP